MRSEIVYIIGGRLVLPDRIVPDGGLSIRSGIIDGVFMQPKSSRSIPKTATVIEAGGAFISPGFVDLHVHGGGGADLMDGRAKAVETMRTAHAAGGTTAMLPTTLTSSDEDLTAALYAFRAAKASNLPGPRLLGVHLEGPYLSLAQAGAQDPRFLMRPRPYHYMRILEAFPEIKRVTVAPELQGAIELAKELTRRGIYAAIGHTDATYDEIKDAMAAGYTHMTHLYSAMSTVKRVRARRIAGAVEAALLLDGLTAEVIADGMHLPEALLKLALKCKGADKLALVTDAMRAAGMPDGEYPLGSSAGGVSMVVDEGVAWLKDRSAFAGSVSLMNKMVGNMAKIAGASVPEAVRMASLTPSRMIGMEAQLGSIEKGKTADIVLFDDDFKVLKTIVGGKPVYSL